MLRLLGRQPHCSSWNAPTDLTDDLVTNRAQSFCPLFNGQLLVTLAADEYDLASDVNRVTGIFGAKIDHELIHGHHADDMSTATTDEASPLSLMNRRRGTRVMPVSLTLFSILFSSLLCSKSLRMRSGSWLLMLPWLYS